MKVIVECNGILNSEVLEGAWWEAEEGGSGAGWSPGVRVMFRRRRN